MNPTPGDRHVSRALTDMSIAHFQEAKNFVSNQTPVIRSPQKNNDYFVFNKADLHRINVKERAPLSRAKKAGFRLTTESFRCIRYSISTAISDEDLNNYDEPMAPEEDAMDFINSQMMLFREFKWAERFLDAASWTVTYAGVAATPNSSQFLRWDVSGSTPIEDVHTYLDTVQKSTGFRPNVIYMGQEVMTVIQNHASVQDRYKANGQGEGSRSPMTLKALAELFGVEEVIVSSAVYNTADENLAASNEYIFGKKALIAYVNRSNTPRVKQPTAFATFAWTGFYGAEEAGYRIKRYRVEEIGGDVVEGDTAFVHRVTGADMAILLTDVVA